MLGRIGVPAALLLAGVLLAGCGGGGGGGAGLPPTDMSRTYTLYVSTFVNGDIAPITVAETLTLDGGGWSLVAPEPNPATLSGTLATLPHGFLQLTIPADPKGGGGAVLYGFELPNGLILLFDGSSIDPQTGFYTGTALLAFNEQGTCPAGDFGENLIVWPSPTFAQDSAYAYGYTAFVSGQSEQFLETQLLLGWPIPSGVQEVVFNPVDGCDKGIVGMGGYGYLITSAAGVGRRVDGQGLPWIASPQPKQWPSLGSVVSAGRNYAGLISFPSCGTDPKLCAQTEATIFLTAAGDGSALQFSTISDLAMGTNAAAILSATLSYSNDSERLMFAPPGLIDTGLLTSGLNSWKLVAALHSIAGKFVLIGMANAPNSTQGPSPKDWAILLLREI